MKLITIYLCIKLVLSLRFSSEPHIQLNSKFKQVMIMTYPNPSQSTPQRKIEVRKQQVASYSVVL